MNFLSKYLFIFYLLVSFPCLAVNSSALEQQADTQIKNLYSQLHALPPMSMPDRIEWISAHFLGTTYILGALGEGAKGRYDQFPEYRIDGFDCDTFVNTVLSLALSDSLPSFQQCQRHNRYKDAEVDYLKRNHFMSLDWNINNQKRGVLNDITTQIKDKDNKKITLEAVALIDKAQWYAHKSSAAIRVEQADAAEQQKLLDELKQKGSYFEAQEAKINYIPFTVLFDQNAKPDLYLFDQIPHGAIIEIVRPNWDLREQIGTALNVSHLGFAIRKDQQLYLRQASSQYGKVVDVPLVDYLIEARKSPTIKGINVQVIVPKQAGIKACRL